MKITEFDASMLPALTRVFNRALSGVPFCYPVDERRLSRAIHGQLAGGKKKSLQAQRCIVAMDGRGIRGFAHWGTAHNEGDVQGAIRFLWFAPGHRVAGEALLAEAEDRLRKREAHVIHVFPHEYTYPCYHLKPAFLSDRIGHVVALLGLEGYERTRGEVFLEWPDMPATAAPPSKGRVKLRVDRPAGASSKPDIRVTAHIGSVEVGACDCTGLAARTSAVEAKDWIFTTWLGVEEEHQGKGIGRLLLTRALIEARKAGYRHAAISTDWDNHRALMFYAGFGYSVTDWTYEFSRKLR